MRSTSAAASRFSRFLSSAATLASIACDDTTAPAPPTTLAFTVQVASAISDTPFSPAVRVAIQDASGNTVTTATNSITVAIGTNTGSGTLSGALTAAAVNGVATFSNLSIDKAGSGYTLSAASPSLTSATSARFDVVPGTAVKLGFTMQPVSALARTPIPTFSVAVQDAAGNTVTGASNNITLTIGTNPGGASFFTGPTTLTPLNGVATFSNVSLSSPGDGYTLTASSINLTNGVSSSFNATIGPAIKLEFAVQPVTTGRGVTLTPAVAVAVQDQAGNTVTTATNSITVAIGTNAGAGILSGTTTVAAVNGVATFSDLSINNEGTDYTLTAATASLVGDVSARFSIRTPLAFATVSAGYFHSCGVATGGAAYCWGANFSGQQGNGGTSASQAPVAVSGGLTFAKIGAGRTHTCGVTPGGVAYCWGDNQDGKLGGGGGAESDVPAAVTGGLTFADAIAGYSHSCGVTTGGAAYCWGSNAAGALGNGTQTAINIPVAVSGGLTFATVSPGRIFTCGLTTGGAAYCWGDNSAGELGDGTFNQRSAPVPVSGQLNFALVSAGGFHACGLTTAGLAYCWGANDFGQLGDVTAARGSDSPVPVTGGHIFATLSAGNRHTCGVTTGGVAYCWGDNSLGHLGNGATLNNSTAPVAVAGGLTFASVIAGRFHTCGVTTGGTAYCWGNNDDGKLGDGTTASRLGPVPVR